VMERTISWFQIFFFYFFLTFKANVEHYPEI